MRAGKIFTIVSFIILTFYMGLPAYAADSLSNGSQSVSLPDQIENKPMETAISGSIYNFIPKIKNNDGSPVSYAVENLPVWASFDTSTGVLSGIAAAGTYSGIVITLLGGKTAAASTVSFNINVAPWRLTKSGQTAVYANYDDGSYQYGAANNYKRDSAGVVTDKVNGIMWQDTAFFEIMDYAAAQKYCGNLTLDGYKDWHIPSLTDLESIVNYGTYRPSVINVLYNTKPDSYYWSTTAKVTDAGSLWTVNFDYGEEYTDTRTGYKYVKCVRGNSTPVKSFTRDEDKEIVTDNNLGLMWQDDADAATKTMLWGDAIGYCENKTLGGYSDWRLPNQRELMTIVDRSQTNPAINSSFVFKASGNYFSSTHSPYHTSGAMGIKFTDGAYAFELGDKYFVRCVRGGATE